MLPRSAAGRAIVKEVDTGAKTVVENHNERFIILQKKTRDSLLGVRFGLHPVTSEVVVTELFSGYPAMECSRIFVGDILSSVNGVRITSVDMATQQIKLADNKVELKLTNVSVKQNDAAAAKKPVPANPAAAAAAKSAAAATPAPAPSGPATDDLLGDLSTLPPESKVAPAKAPAVPDISDGAAVAPATSSEAAKAASLLDDLVLGDDDFADFKASAPAPVSAVPSNVAAAMAMAPPQPPGTGYYAQPPPMMQPMYGQQPPMYGQQGQPMAPGMYGGPPMMQQPPVMQQQPPGMMQQPPMYGQQPPMYGQQGQPMAPGMYGGQPMMQQPPIMQPPATYGQQGQQEAPTPSQLYGRRSVG